MTVLIIDGSPHAKGGTNASLQIVEKELADSGVTVEYAHIGALAIRGCISCYACMKTGKCAIAGDPVNATIELMKKADGIIIASPVYYGGIAGTLKSFLDRAFFAGSGFAFKVGAAIVISRREGGISTFHEVNNYFNLAQMIIAPSRYWLSVYGNNEDEIAQDVEGVQMLKTVARNMAWLMKAVASAPKREIPEDETTRANTNFIR